MDSGQGVFACALCMILAYAAPKQNRYEPAPPALFVPVSFILSTSILGSSSQFLPSQLPAVPCFLCNALSTCAQGDHFEAQDGLPHQSRRHVLLRGAEPRLEWVLGGTSHRWHGKVGDHALLPPKRQQVRGQGKCPCDNGNQIVQCVVVNSLIYESQDLKHTSYTCRNVYSVFGFFNHL